MRFPFDKYKFGTLYGKKGKYWKCGWHSGLDMYSIAIGGDGKVHPIADGKVTKTAYSNSYGSHIYITHPDGYLSLYAHLSRIDVNVGDEVTGKSVIGIEGSTGNSTGTHLHLEIHKGKYSYPASIDPKTFIEAKIEATGVEEMTGEEIYNKLQSFLSKQSVPNWAKKEFEESIKMGITDGTNPMELMPRYQAAIMVKRMIKNQ